MSDQGYGCSTTVIDCSTGPDKEGVEDPCQPQMSELECDQIRQAQWKPFEFGSHISKMLSQGQRNL